MMKINLHDWDKVVINSSGGKDSQTALRVVVQLAEKQNYPLERLVVVHADLGDEEWPGVPELAETQAKHYGLQFFRVARRKKDGSGDTILQYAKRRGKWPDNKNRWCTSDFKRNPCSRIITQLSREIQGPCKMLNVFGFRAQESPARAKRQVLIMNKNLTNKTRQVYDWLPIHDWLEDDVWSDIKESQVPYHWAYDKGMPRLSCSFCIFAPRNALIIAGIERPEKLQEYVDVEEQINHTFRVKQSLIEIQTAIKKGEQPVGITNGDWNM